MESRSKKSVRNILTGFGSKLILLILAFSTKTAFVRLLGAEYNGINGLYGNILTVLSLADLGIGNVLTFSLYQALKDGDKCKLTTLVNSFKKIYRVIAFSVLGIGLCLIPFLKFIVKSALPTNKTIIYYILYLLNSVSSYFVVYKTTVITADQKSYITNICSTVSTALMYVLQLIYLYFTHDFLGYLIIQVLCTIGVNLVLNLIANKMYPYLNDKSLIDKNKIPKGMIGENIKSTFIYKICVVLINNTDNILISIILGTVYVGYYSNYYALTQYINTFIAILSTGLLASLGNLNAENNKEKSYKIFKTLELIYTIIANFCVCAFANCLQGFIPIWLGDEYVLPAIDVIAILLLFYITTSAAPVWMFRETMGLFKDVKYIMIAALIVNVIISIILGKAIGLSGIIFATSISKLSTHYWYEPNMLFKKKFDKKVGMYFVTQIKNLICTLLSLVLSLLICNYLPKTLIFLVIRVMISGFIVIFFEIIFNFKTEEFKDLKDKILFVLKR